LAQSVTLDDCCTRLVHEPETLYLPGTDVMMPFGCCSASMFSRPDARRRLGEMLRRLLNELSLREAYTGQNIVGPFRGHPTYIIKRVMLTETHTYLYHTKYILYLSSFPVFFSLEFGQI